MNYELCAHTLIIIIIVIVIIIISIIMGSIRLFSLLCCFYGRCPLNSITIYLNTDISSLQLHQTQSYYSLPPADGAIYWSLHSLLKKMVLQGSFGKDNYGSTQCHDHSKDHLHDQRILCMVKWFFRLMENPLCSIYNYIGSI